MKRLTNAYQIMAPAIEKIIEMAEWRSLPEASKADILALLKSGKTPAEIESNVILAIQKRAPGMAKNELERIGARYFLAATYALENNLHRTEP